MDRELLVKLSNLSHSSLLKILFFLKLQTIFAPTGYPLMIPIIKAKEPSPLILKIGSIKILKILIDIKGMLEKKEFENAGYIYWRL